MTPAPADVSVPSAEARPVDSSERLALLDTLRGFALCGVFISNVMVWFSGRVFLPREQVLAAMNNASLADTVTWHAFSVLVAGKFITLFSFLFGLGFAVQMGRAEARGASITPLYVRRLGVMLVMGLAHLFLIWYGDILSTYAVLGFGLLLFRGRSDRTLLSYALLFALGWSIVGVVIFKYPQLMADTPEAGAAIAKAASEKSGAIRARTLAAFTSGSWLDATKATGDFFFSDYLPMLVAITLSTFGRFLLGLLAGRRRIFHDVPQHLRLFRRLLGWGLVAGVIGSGSGLVLQQLMLKKVFTPETLPTWVPFVTAPLRHLGELGFAAVYVSGFTLLFQRATWQRVLGLLAPVGRMALTNYLSQSIISVLFFYGYGLGFITKVGPAACVAYCLAVFSVQVVWSHLWLSRFRFGPAEWVWRSLTYGKAQPMRRDDASGQRTTAPA
ncbi:DUF418 domain-containing protein [Pyxidicoccus fallax]|uniref:DUF418 domain-containing protein n=1 Tax=Pyxidicoccus fallax TaxID=394095 RepID=A0A848L4J9_9BACT|nr:DUF418 domain-containing protein [Pyxidicoccus fallax]NMO13546.1 DUF418 domain-containing protein [Pyxidicoccus fallax]NPC76746.1 DUF418 domain-containing protein [Pyxidicoccus fallax]